MSPHLSATVQKGIYYYPIEPRFEGAMIADTFETADGSYQRILTEIVALIPIAGKLATKRRCQLAVFRLYQVPE
jgi:hypothetical protein